MSIINSTSSVEESTTDKERRRRSKIKYTSMDLQEQKTTTTEKTLKPKNAAPQPSIIKSQDPKQK